MKITIFISSMMNSGGTERVAANLSAMFAVRGHNVQILSLRSEHSSFYKLNASVQFKFLGVDTRSRDKSKFAYLWQIISSIRSYIKLEKPDVVLAIWTDLAIFSVLAAIGLKVKVVACEHTSFARQLTTPERLRPLVYPLADAIVVLTEKDRAICANLNPKSFVIPNAATITRIQNNIIKKNIVLAVGRITKLKGFDLLIDAWQIAHRSLNDWQLKIIGGIEDSNYEAILKEKISAYKLMDSVTIIPAVADIFKEYSMGKIFVLSSRMEGLPMVMIEAMSVGLPVVSFDCSAGPRELIIDGYSGVLVENGNVQELAEKIVKLAKDENLQKKYAANAKMNINSKFSEECVYKKWMQVFTEVNK